MNKKIFLKALAVVSAMCSCGPMEDSVAWTDNCAVNLHWELSGNETGQQPEGVDELNVRFMPYTGATGMLTFPMKGYDDIYDIQTNTYDLLVFHDSSLLVNYGKLKTAAIELPVELNEQREPVLQFVPDTMLYAGCLDSVPVDYYRRLECDVYMKKMLKKLTFRVYIGDDKGLYENCKINLSGMAYRMKVWNRECDENANGVLLMELQKEGRYLNNDLALTLFTGSVYCLGTVGQNILYFTYTNAKGEEVNCKYDLSSYLKDWGHEDKTVVLRILNNKSDLDVDGWDVGNESDLVITK